MQLSEMFYISCANGAGKPSIQKIYKLDSGSKIEEFLYPRFDDDGEVLYHAIWQGSENIYSTEEEAEEEVKEILAGREKVKQDAQGLMWRIQECMGYMEGMLDFRLMGNSVLVSLIKK